MGENGERRGRDLIGDQIVTMTIDSLSPEVTFLIDFNLHKVPAALGIDVPPGAAAEMMGIAECTVSF